MGFYLKRALRAGPFRFNLSKSGIGVSTGVPGFRVGLVGPRGHYVHMGRGGVYYRKSLNHRDPVPGSATPSESRPSEQVRPSDAVLEDLTGATVLQLAGSDPSDVVSQINEAQAKPELWKFASVGVAVLVIAALLTYWPAAVVVLLVAVPGLWWLRHWDHARRTVVVFYDVNDESASRFQQLVDAFGELRSSHQANQVVAAGAVGTTQAFKVSAGATEIDQLAPARLLLSGPPVVVTNIEVPSIESAGRSLYFLPDRILVRQGRAYAGIAYRDVEVESKQVRWIEAGTVPSDTQIVGKTWRYVNKKGGPDQRYKNNRELPILLESTFRLSAPNGFNGIWQFSRPDAAKHFAVGLKTMGQ